jgi:DMSO/TMAO reductase YedYZ molybdopterin-dependent catalytic subunit
MMDRRKFLSAVGATGMTAAAAGVAGELLIGKRFSSAPRGVQLASPSSPAATGEAPPPKLDIAPLKALPDDEALNITGLSPFYTPEAKFYRVDTAMNVPRVSAATWQLRIRGMVDKPMTITFNDLIRRPMVEHDVTLTCVSESVGGNYVGNAHWQGVLLADLLREAGIQRGADQIVMRDAGGMTIGVATDPVLDGRKSLLAVGMNGRLLSPEHGYPVRVVIPGLYGYVSATKWVVDMEFTTFGAFDAFWVKRGWSKQAPIKTESRIDVP